MSTLLDWLEVQVNGPRSIVQFYFRLLLLDYGWSFLSMLILTAIGMQFADRTSGISISWEFLFFVLLVNVLIEEVFFRFIPLVLAVSIFGNSRRWLVLVVTVLASIGFGWAHGGPQYVLVQGVGGLFLSAVFLKCGGFEKKWRKALTCSTLYHYTFDVLIFLLVLSLT